MGNWPPTDGDGEDLFRLEPFGEDDNTEGDDDAPAVRDDVIPMSQLPEFGSPASAGSAADEPLPIERGFSSGDASGFPVESILTDFFQQNPENGPSPELPAEDDDAEISEDDAPDVVAARKFVHALAKSVRVVRMYPAENPVCKRFAEDAAQKMIDCLRQTDMVRLAIGKNKVLYHGETVLEEDGGEDSFCGRMFWDGIREVSFHVGATPQELLEFMSLFRIRAKESIQGEEDFITLLWKAAFEHITHIALEDIFDLESAADAVPEEFGTEYMNYVDMEMHDLDDDEVETKANTISAEIKAKLSQDPDEDENLFGITADERAELKTEIDGEDSPRMLKDVLQIITEALFLEQNERDFVDLVQVLAGAMLSLIAEGRLAEAGEVITILQELHDEREDATPAMQAPLAAALRAVWDETRREQFVKRLQMGALPEADVLEPFFRVLPDEALGPLYETLDLLQNERPRRILLAVLTTRARSHPEPFVEFLGVRDPERVLTTLRILAGTRNPGLVMRYKALLKHPDFRVRREALAALAKSGAGATEVLLRALEDPDKRLRVIAAKNLAGTGRLAIPVLLTTIQSKDFDARELTEKRAFYESLAFAGGASVITVFEDALTRKHLFKKTEAEEIRACACEALGWIDVPEARALLEKHANEKSALVRTAAQSALRRLEQGADRAAFLREAA